MRRVESASQHLPDSRNSYATVRYELNERGYVILDLFTLRGKHIKTLVNAVLEPGTYHIDWDGLNDRGEEVQDGVYLYKMLFDGAEATRNLLLID